MTPLLLTLLLSQAGQPVLSLGEALKQADEQNLDLQAARARLAQARTASARAWSAYLPTVLVAGSYIRNSDEANIAMPTGYFIRDVGQPSGPPFDPTQPVSPQNPPGQPTTLTLFPADIAEVTIQTRDQLAAQAEVRQALIAPTLWSAIQNAATSTEVVEYQVEATRRELLISAAQIYLAAAGLKESANVQEDLLEILRQQESDARKRFEAGAAPKLDVLRAELDRTTSEQELIRTRNAYQSALSSLAAVLNREMDFDVERPRRVPEVSRDAQALQAQALEQRPDIESARRSRELADGLRRSVIFSYFPALSLNGVYRVSNVGGFTGRNDTWFVNLALSWVLWDGGLREAQLREAAARINETQAQLESTEVKARDEVRRALLELASAEANREKSVQQVAVAQENLTLLRAAYNAGATTALEVSQASGSLLRAELAQLNEILNAQLAALRVLKAAGAFEFPTIAGGIQ